MGFRTVVITKRSKLEYSLGYLIVRSDEEKRVFIEEINTVIIESTAVSMTASLLSELSKHKIKVILCDEKCDPYGEIISYNNAHNCSKRIMEQFKWDNNLKSYIWQEIIKEKIRNQASLLKKNNKNEGYEMLLKYFDEVEPNDLTYKESYAAKVYFNDLFGPAFVRRADIFPNNCLNYGSMILLSAFNREIVASGYLTQIGIHHCNEFNYFNLSCDFIEPYRPFVDELALTVKAEDHDFKRTMRKILTRKVKIRGEETSVEKSVGIYLHSIYNSFDTGNLILNFPSNYEL